MSGPRILSAAVQGPVSASLFDRRVGLRRGIPQEEGRIPGEAGRGGWSEKEGEKTVIPRPHRWSRWSRLCWWPALALTHSIAHSILDRKALHTQRRRRICRHRLQRKVYRASSILNSSTSRRVQFRVPPCSQHPCNSLAAREFTRKQRDGRLPLQLASPLIIRGKRKTPIRTEIDT